MDERKTDGIIKEFQKNNFSTFFEKNKNKRVCRPRIFMLFSTFHHFRLILKCIDLKRITRYNLGIVRVGHFWKCYGSEASKS
jgi:hypothetical protein